GESDRAARGAGTWVTWVHAPGIGSLAPALEWAAAMRPAARYTRLPARTPFSPARFDPMTQVPPTPSTPEALPQGELEFITELCSVVAEQSELQPILDWLVHKSTRLMGADEC